MRKPAFIIAILGMFVLALLLNAKPKEIDNFEDLNALEINQKVSINGKVVSEKVSYNNKILMLDNGIELVCECEESFKDKEISAIGVISDYNNKKQVRVLRIFVED